MSNKMSESDSWSMRERIKTWRTALKDMKERLGDRAREGMMSEGIREMKLYHGLKLIFSTQLLGEYLDICYCNDTQEYLVLDDELMVSRYSMQGKYIMPPFTLSSSMVFTKFIWCAELKTFVCYIPHDDLIRILTRQFKLIETVKNDFKIRNIFYLPLTNEIIVVGPTIVTRYQMNRSDENLDSYNTINFRDETCGPIWTIQQSALIQYGSLRMVGSYLTTIYIIPLTTDEDQESNVPVKFIAKKLNASFGPITALYFHSTSQWIVSGDQQGTVSAWTLTLDCVLKYLDGHKGAVRMITSHPSICGFITSSEDDVLQVWSCNLRGKMESFTELGAVSSMAINKLAGSIATLGTKLNFFHMHQLYTFYSALTAPAMILFSTRNSVHPIRIIVRTSDNVVSMLSSVSGRQLNIQVLSSTITPISIAYSAITDSIYTIPMETGTILVSNTKTRPMKLKNIPVSSERNITCIVVHDHYDEIYGSNRKPLKPQTMSPIRARIIVGTDEGELVLINETTGKYERAMPAHDGPVIKLHVSSLSRHVVSIGKDRCVKTWRILPNIIASLALIHCIYYTIPITDLTSMGFIICAVSSTTNSKFHQLFMYNINERTKLEHHSSKDHAKQILGIASSESLLICATSSEDGTIRVWNQQNFLLKILEVNICAKRIAFSSLRGDIVFSGGKHLYRLPYDNYLPPKFRAQIITNDIVEEEDENPMPEDKEYREYEDDEEKTKTLHPVSSVPLGSLDPTLDVPRFDLMLREHMYRQLKCRDEDIIQIRDGALQARKLVKRKTVMNEDDWKRHVDDLLGASARMAEDIEPPHDIWSSIQKYNVKKIPHIPAILPGLYARYNTEKLSDYPILLKEFEYSKQFTGFLPNSVIVEILKEIDKTPPPSEPSEKKIFKYIYPSEVETEQELMTDSNLFNLSQLEGLENSLD